ncbi:MAG: hypothetical protein D6E12_18550 [Desulfovibrio sp.]|nr:MAG: hypothetical protein D6E12_18550 [Desulfovibrio sp.]
MICTRIEELLNGQHKKERSTCPGYNDLAMYLDGRTKLKTTIKLESHFSTCMDCRADIIELKQLLKNI